MMHGKMHGLPLWLSCAVLALGTSAGAQTTEDLLQAAKAGDAAAQFAVAELFRTGEGVLQNYARAADWYRAAAEQEDPRALNALGALLISGLGVPRDPEAGFALLAQAAKDGTPRHLFDLAMAYEKGLGTPVDTTQALSLMQKAADGGWAEAQVSLGVMYHLGTDVAVDIPRAISLYSGPAEAGHPRALNNLGLIYARGQGVDQDYLRAADFFARAAERGLPEALKNLGAMYENGFGVAVNEEEAKRLYRLAAQASGDGTPGQVAYVYDSRLAPADPEQAEAYQRAAGRGDPVAQFLTAYLLLTTTQVQGGIDYRRAARLLESSANKGLPAAMANLGLLMFEGKGVLQDYVEGYKWLTLAALDGPTDVIGMRDALARRMTVEQINVANDLAEAFLPDPR